ncbi:MAG: NAD-dependent epimerase/dehydratase family protein [Planctomycetota bacterium]|jgi:UDP-glucose 4-epimerase
MNLLVLGASGTLGQAFLRRLVRDNPFRSILAMDDHPPTVLGTARFVPGDPREAPLDDLVVMNDIDRIVVLSGDGDAWHGEETLAGRILGFAQALGIQRLVFSSRDLVYANPAGQEREFRTETAPILSEASTGCPIGHAKAAVERRLSLSMAEAPRTEVVSVRLSPIVGRSEVAPIDTVLSLPWIIAPTRARPMLQLLHIDDAAEIFVRALTRPGVRGPVNAAGPEPLGLDEVAGILERPLRRLPTWAGQALVRGLWTLGLLDHARPPDPVMLHQIVPMQTRRLAKVLDYTPRLTTRQALALWRRAHAPR